MFTGNWLPAIQGGDVTYLVNFFRNISANQPCYLNGLWATADVNGDCSVNGADLSTLVNFSRGIVDLSYCSQYPPLWVNSSNLPDSIPIGWPNCDNSPVTTGIKVIPVESGK